MMPWALAIFAALTPLYVVRFAPVLGGVRLPTTLLELAFGVLVVLWLRSLWGEKGSWKRFGARLQEAFGALWDWRIGVGLFVAGSVVGVVLAADTLGAIGLWRAYILEPLLLFVIARDVLRTTRDRERVVTALAVSVAVIGATAVFQKITGYGIPAVWQPEDVRRVTSIYGFPNAVGLFIAPLMMVFLARALALLEERQWLRAAFFGGVSALGIASCVFAVSEGALFGMAAGIAVLGLCFPRLRVPTLLAIIVGCLAVMLWPALRGYVSIAVSLRDQGGYIRAFIWADAWKMLMADPIFGVGFGNYPAAFAAFRTRPWIEIFQYPHNIVLNFWSEMGLLGLSGFAVIVGTMAKKAHGMIAKKFATSTQGQLWLGAGVLAALATILVHGLVDVPYFKNDLAMLFWLLAALLV